MERQLRTHTVYDGRLIRVRADTVELSNGRRATREVVEHPGAVGVAPVTDGGSVVLVEQHRYAVGRTMLEIPAGTCEPGESPEDTARRELEEETGYRADLLVEIGRFFVSPGWANEEIVPFRAEALTATGHRPNQDEILGVVKLDATRIPGLMRDGTIADAKTIIALHLVSAYLM